MVKQYISCPLLFYEIFFVSMFCFYNPNNYAQGTLYIDNFMHHDQSYSYKKNLVSIVFLLRSKNISNRFMWSKTYLLFIWKMNLQTKNGRVHSIHRKRKYLLTCLWSTYPSCINVLLDLIIIWVWSNFHRDTI